MDIQLNPVSSSNLAAVGHDKDSSTLRIQFNSGTTWDYDGVSEDVYNSLLSAPSVGKYFNQHIKGSYSGGPV